MKSNFFLLKIITINLILLKILCLQENTTKKNTSIYLNYTSYFINSTIRTLSERNFDTIIFSNINQSLDCLILFTLKRCSNCNHVMRLTENIEKYYSQKNPKLKFYKVDSYTNHFTAMRFDIYKIPSYVYITKGLYASFSPKEKTENELINFIESKNKEFMRYPGKIGYLGVCKKVINNLTLKIKNKILFWNEYLTWIFLLSTIFAFLYFEYKIYKVGCCGNKNNNSTNNKREYLRQKKNNMNENNNDKKTNMFKDDKKFDEDSNSEDENINKKEIKNKKFKNKLKGE